MCGALLQTEIVFVCKMEKYILDGEIHTKDDCNFQLYLFSHLSVHSVDRHPAIRRKIEVCTLLASNTHLR